MHKSVTFPSSLASAYLRGSTERFMEPALFTSMPAARDHIPWLSVGHYPTPVVQLDGIAGANTGLWVKREDLGAADFGGNKVRKLEFIFGEARARGAIRLVTFGSYSSSHVAATAVHAPRFGFDLDATLFPEPMSDIVRRNVGLTHAAGARIHTVSHVASVLPRRWIAQHRAETFWIAGGGSSTEGTLGWVSGGLEILAQIRAGEMPPPAAVYVPLGSAGTFAGLCWSLWSDPPIEVVGVEVVRPAGWARWNARNLLRCVEARLAPFAAGVRQGAAPIVRVVREDGRIEDPDAISRARTRGLSLDPVYTEPTLDVLLRDVRTGRWKGRHVLFIDTLNGVDDGPFLSRNRAARPLPAPLRVMLG